MLTQQLGRHYRGLALTILAAACVTADAVICDRDQSPLPMMGVVTLLFLTPLAVLLSVPRVQVTRGFLSLGAIATNSAALTLSPRFAAVVGIAAGASITLLHRRVSARVVQVITVATGPVAASAVHQSSIRIGNVWFADTSTLLTATACSLVLTGLVGSFLVGESPATILRQNLNLQWVGAFAYFAIAALIISRFLGGGSTGDIALAALVAVLALALSDSIAGRQLRLRLQAQVNDSERMVAYARVVEGTVHNLRNHLAAASGHLDEVPGLLIDTVQARHVSVANAAVSDAIEVLDQLQAGSSGPRVRTVTNLVILAHDAAYLVQGRAEKKGVRVTIAHLPSGAVTRTDPLLVKQVLANLILNAIEAVSSDGHVWIEFARHGRRLLVSVRDDGPGVAEKFRARLFEPHFTTKPRGNGIGLYVSHRIASQLGGDLRYEGSKAGAVFTLVLPAERD